MKTEGIKAEKPKTIWYSTPRAKRNRKIVQFTLDPSAIAHLATLAKGRMSRSLFVEALINDQNVDNLVLSPATTKRLDDLASRCHLTRAKVLELLIDDSKAFSTVQNAVK